MSAGGLGAPRWLLLPSYAGTPVTDLEALCTALRERLGSEADDLPMDGHAEHVLEIFLRRLGEAERTLLSRKKQRATKNW